MPASRMTAEDRYFYQFVNRKSYRAENRDFYNLTSMRSFGSRVRYAREKRGLSQHELARRIKIKQPSLLAIEKGPAKSSKHLSALARALQVEPRWLEGDDSAEPEWDRTNGEFEDTAPPNPGLVEIGHTSYSPIARYDAGLSCGDGSLIEANPTPLGYHLIETQWLHTITSSKADSLAVVRVNGDSMERTLFDGDWVLIDRGQTRIAREGIYAIQVFDHTWIKRISLNLRDKLVRIISDNAVVPMQEYPEEDLIVKGRVIALVARRLP